MFDVQSSRAPPCTCQTLRESLHVFGFSPEKAFPSGDIRWLPSFDLIENGKRPIPQHPLAARLPIVEDDVMPTMAATR